MGTGTAIDEIYYPREDIRRNVDWYGSTGFQITNDENISQVVFFIIFKRGDQTILTLSESAGTIVHSGNFVLRLKCPSGINASLSPGLIRGDLIGVVSGIPRFFGTIETVIR